MSTDSLQKRLDTLESNVQVMKSWLTEAKQRIEVLEGARGPTRKRRPKKAAMK